MKRTSAILLVIPLAGLAESDTWLSYGSGHFGEWTYDRWGLPAYDYTLDERSDPRAEVLEAGGATPAWHQVGNDRFMANAYNHGYVQVWTQDRDYQWLNKVDESVRQYGGGYGYLKIHDQTLSTLAGDRGDRDVQRRFGVGYYRRAGKYAGISVQEVVYAPYGNASYLYHDVTLENSTPEPMEATWWEYWGVNPWALPSPLIDQPPRGSSVSNGSGRAAASQASEKPTSQSERRTRQQAPRKMQFGVPRPLGAVRYDSTSSLLSVDQLPIDGDDRPLTIFAAAVDAPVSGFETSTERFFGSGTRARPEAVVRDRTADEQRDGRDEEEQSQALFAFRSPVSLGPRQKVTLRYVYGYAHREDLEALVAQAGSVESPLESSQRRWRDWLPQAQLDAEHAWLARELAWAAYLVRSASMYEEPAGHRVITEGGWYQYGAGIQVGFRDPLQHVLPVIYADPKLAREVILYSAQQQRSTDGVTPFAIGRLGSSSSRLTGDNDIWLMLAVTEYVFASRDFDFLDTRVAWRDRGEASLWEHVKLAYRHQESFAGGPHGLYTLGSMGDWGSLIVEEAGITESTLIAAQVAYVYPRVAEIAAQRGDRAFAEALRTSAQAAKKVAAGEWTGRGWLSRGYAKEQQVGAGVMYAETQPWGLLSGAVDARRAPQLIANIRRFLTGIEAPDYLNGPSRIGSSQSPALNDPDIVPEPNVGEYTAGDNDSVYIGGIWYAINGWLTWALSSQERAVPGARDFAWDELKRNTLAAHATAFPDHWNGIISVDDHCWGWYSLKPENRARCGLGRATIGLRYYGQNTHQPAWLMYGAIRMAGIHATADGYLIDPSVPLDEYSLNLPTVGIHTRPGGASGYFRLDNGAPFTMRLRKPEGYESVEAVVRADGRRVDYRDTGDYVEFTLPGSSAGAARQWSIDYGTPGTAVPVAGPLN